MTPEGAVYLLASQCLRHRALGSTASRRGGHGHRPGGAGQWSRGRGTAFGALMPICEVLCCQHRVKVYARKASVVSDIKVM